MVKIFADIWYVHRIVEFTTVKLLRLMYEKIDHLVGTIGVIQ